MFKSRNSCPDMEAMGSPGAGASRREAQGCDSHGSGDRLSREDPSLTDSLTLALGFRPLALRENPSACDSEPLVHGDGSPRKQTHLVTYPGARTLSIHAHSNL